MVCEACKAKDELIERLLSRLQGHEVEAEGISVMDHLADAADAHDEERKAREFENLALSSEITEKFRSLHLTSPYAHCTITEAEDGEN